MAVMFRFCLTKSIAALQPEKMQLIIDGTFGAGGYTKRILETGASVTAVDRDPSAIEAGRAMEKEYAGRLTLVQGTFSTLDQVALLGAPDGIVLDIGVSSMQIDEAERGFRSRKMDRSTCECRVRVRVLLMSSIV